MGSLFVRHALTWETGHAGGRSFAAVACEKGVMALLLALPVPVLAATGMSLPLPDVVYRIGVAAIERTAAIAEALPGVDTAPTAPPPKRKAVVAQKARAVAHTPAAAVATHAPQRNAHPVAPHAGVVRAKPSTSSHFSSGGHASTGRTEVPVVDPPAATSTSTKTSEPDTTTPRTTDTPSTTNTPSASSTPAANAGSASDASAKAAEEQAARDAAAAQAAADQAAKAAAEQAAKDAKAAQEAADRAARAAEQEAEKAAKAAAQAAEKAQKEAEQAAAQNGQRTWPGSRNSGQSPPHN
jgi:hypothetical protein